MNQINISIIIPVFMVEKYLDQCLSSVRNQTENNIEIICVYTKSNDRSLEILQNHQREDSRISIIYRDDGGLGGARNTGMKNAQGKYIVFVDSDDYVQNNMCERLMKLLESNSSDFAMCAVQSIDAQSEKEVENAWCSTLPFPDELVEKAITYKDLPQDQVVSANAPVIAWNKIYSRAFLKKNELYFAENLRYEDNLFYYSVLLRAKSFVFTQEKYYCYRVNREASLQNSSFQSQSVFDGIRALYPIKKELIKVKAPKSVYCFGMEYVFHELEWRYFSLCGRRRAYIKALKEQLSKDDFDVIRKRINDKATKSEKEYLHFNVDELCKISIIVPCYNSEKYIVECLDSACKQTLDSIEVICVDDCSTDGTIGVIEQYQEKEPRVKLIKKDENSGAGISRNIGLDCAKGEYVFFMDSDDWFTDDSVLECMYNAAVKKGAFAVAGNLECIRNGAIEKYSGHYFERNEWVDYSEYQPYPTWGFTRFLYNIEYIKENGITFPNFRYYEDPYFLVSFMTKCRRFYGIEKTVYSYRIHDNHHSSLRFNQAMDILHSIEQILSWMHDYDMENYYGEYKTLIGFLYKIVEYNQEEKSVDKDNKFSEKRNKEKLVIKVNDVLSHIDFSQADKYMGKEWIIRSYGEFCRTRVPDNAKEYKYYFTASDRLKAILKRIARPIKSLYARALRFLFRPVIRVLFESMNEKQEQSMKKAQELESIMWRICEEQHRMSTQFAEIQEELKKKRRESA